MNLTVIAGARPNFVKIAPIIKQIELKIKTGEDIKYRLVHTGQHYDDKLSGQFFEELRIPHPHVNLKCGGGTQAEQTANIMVEFEKELMANPADLVVVVGDVTSTMACSIVAKKQCVKVAHIEAGIRSWDQTMPEEINRMVTDSITDYFFTTSTIANDNLRKNGIPDNRIFFVGNVMIDTLMANMNRLRAPKIFTDLGLDKNKYIVLTMHRPANVDQYDKLKETINEITKNVEDLAVVFPIHPRTARAFSKKDLSAKNLNVVDPLGYLEFNYLVKNSKAVITDSGGITEETTIMGIPCLTLRDSTERPETCTIGTNMLVGTNPKAIKPSLEKLFAGNWKKGGIPPLWDGKVAERIIDIILDMKL